MGFLFCADFSGKGEKDTRKRTGSSRKMNGGKRQNELYDICAGGISGNHAGRHSADDEKGKQYREILCRKPEHELGRDVTEHSGHMDLGAGIIHVGRKCIYQRLCRAVLVSGSECAVPDPVHTVCKTDPEQYAGRDYTVRFYVSEV